MSARAKLSGNLIQLEWSLPNVSCVAALCRRQDLHTHETSECGARLISCPSGCGGGGGGGGAATLFPARALDVHLKYDCAFRLVRCAGCRDEVTARELDAHKQTACRFVFALLRVLNHGTRLWEQWRGLSATPSGQ